MIRRTQKVRLRRLITCMWASHTIGWSHRSVSHILEWLAFMLSYHAINFYRSTCIQTDGFCLLLFPRLTRLVGMLQNDKWVPTFRIKRHFHIILLFFGQAACTYMCIRVSTFASAAIRAVATVADHWPVFLSLFAFRQQFVSNTWKACSFALAHFPACSPVLYIKQKSHHETYARTVV